MYLITADPERVQFLELAEGGHGGRRGGGELWGRRLGLWRRVVFVVLTRAVGSGRRIAVLVRVVFGGVLLDPRLLQLVHVATLGG